MVFIIFYRRIQLDNVDKALGIWFCVAIIILMIIHDKEEWLLAICILGQSGWTWVVSFGKKTGQTFPLPSLFSSPRTQNHEINHPPANSVKQPSDLCLRLWVTDKGSLPPPLFFFALRQHYSSSTSLTPYHPTPQAHSVQPSLGDCGLTSLPTSLLSDFWMTASSGQVQIWVEPRPLLFQVVFRSSSSTGHSCVGPLFMIIGWGGAQLRGRSANVHLLALGPQPAPLLGLACSPSLPWDTRSRDHFHM